MSVLRKSFRWYSEKKRESITIAIPRNVAGFGFTVAWTKPIQADFVNMGGTAEKAGLLPGDKIIAINKISVTKKTKEEIENIVKNVGSIMELEVIRSEKDFSSRKRQTSLRRKESIAKKGSRTIILDSDVILWRRERALLKLLVCEEDLLTTINTGKENLITPLRKQSTLATAAELRILFGNIEEVWSVLEKNVQQLRSLTQGTGDEVGKLYTKQVDERISILRKYISGLLFARILLKYKLWNKIFREFIQMCESNEQTNLSVLIEKPYKYIKDQTDTLTSLLSCTPVGHRDYVNLESVVTAFQTFQTEVEVEINRMSQFENFEDINSPYAEEEPYVNLEMLQEKTLFTKGPKNASLVSPERYWLFSGQLCKVEGKHYVDYWALLLSDCLILARRPEQRVLLVLEEPIMLSSVYQATFDIKKCDSEFRILFMKENQYKTLSSRNQWVSWILRAPNPSIKMLWKEMLLNQLSAFSTEALSTGVKKCFVHTKTSTASRETLPRIKTKIRESSFTASKLNPNQHVRNVSDVKFAKPAEHSLNSQRLASRYGGIWQKDLSCLEKNKSSYSSLDETGRQLTKSDIIRSKSFGSDIQDYIPFIDSADDAVHSGTESNFDEQVKIGDSKEIEQTFLRSQELNQVDLEHVQEQDRDIGEFGTALSLSKTVQTDLIAVCADDIAVCADDIAACGDDIAVCADDVAVYSDNITIRRSPRKKFPRMGTFEKIRMENRKPQSVGTGCRSEIAKDPPEKTKSDHKNRQRVVSGKTMKGFFGRLWKRQSGASAVAEREHNTIPLKTVDRGGIVDETLQQVYAPTILEESPVHVSSNDNSK